MAGAFTHIMVCDVAKGKDTVPQALRQLLSRHVEFLFLGSVSPDLPYLSFKTGQINWADVMHYERTNGVAILGHAEIKSTWPDHKPQDELFLVWLLGFISHLVTDATIHPVVQAIVGEYATHKEAHRVCEMTEDSLIFHAVKNIELTYADFAAALRFCDQSPDFHALMDFWKRQLVAAYPDKHDKVLAPALWFKTYTDAIKAVGSAKATALFRHAGLGGKFYYHSAADLRKSYTDDCSRYYDQIRLPGGHTGTFVPDAFERAVHNVAEAWTFLFNGLSNHAAVDDCIRNWNLDTGVDMDAATPGEVTYWRNDV